MSCDMSASASKPRGTLYIAGKTVTGVSVYREIPLEHPQETNTFFLSYRDGAKHALLGGESSVNNSLFKE